jgi:hypothetical protein
VQFVDQQPLIAMLPHMAAFHFRDLHGGGDDAQAVVGSLVAWEPRDPGVSLIRRQQLVSEVHEVALRRVKSNTCRKEWEPNGGLPRALGKPTATWNRLVQRELDVFLPAVGGTGPIVGICIIRLLERNRFWTDRRIGDPVRFGWDLGDRNDPPSVSDGFHSVPKRPGLQEQLQRQIVTTRRQPVFGEGTNHVVHRLVLRR